MLVLLKSWTELHTRKALLTGRPKGIEVKDFYLKTTISLLVLDDGWPPFEIHNIMQ